MTTDILDINDFIVLIEQSNVPHTLVHRCEIDTDVVGFVFYGSGKVTLEIRHNNTVQYEMSTSGMALSFFGNQKVAFAHEISPDRPLQSISIFTKVSHLQALPTLERSMFREHVPQLLAPQQDFVKGPAFYMNLDMQQAVDKIFTTTYRGNTRLLFLKSQVNELLAHFFACLSASPSVAMCDQDKLEQAREIITRNMAQPPSLTELSKSIGLNSHKLKKNFKALFGMPVFKYLQEERLKKAYLLLSSGSLSVQETAWAVGYESLSSFSNMFQKKYGLRPADLRQQFRPNKS